MIQNIRQMLISHKNQKAIRNDYNMIDDPVVFLYGQCNKKNKLKMSFETKGRRKGTVVCKFGILAQQAIFPSRISDPFQGKIVFSIPCLGPHVCFFSPNG